MAETLKGKFIESDYENKSIQELLDIVESYKNDGSLRQPVIGLALGGGASLGLAHIGVLQVLERYKIKPTKVAGTSMGAIVGAFYAMNIKPRKMREIARKIRVYKFLDVNLNGKGLLNGRGVNRIIGRYIPKDTTFKDLKCEFACNAVDLISGEEVILNEGSVLKSIRASFSVPAFFSPVTIGDKLLIDGGLLNNVPDDIVKNMKADIIISVNVVNGYQKTQKIKRMRDVVYYSTLLVQIQSRKNKKSYSNIEITPQLSEHKQYIFSKRNAEEVIAIGAKSAKEYIKNILIEIIKFYLNTAQTVK